MRDNVTGFVQVLLIMVSPFVISAFWVPSSEQRHKGRGSWGDKATGCQLFRGLTRIRHCLDVRHSAAVSGSCRDIQQICHVIWHLLPVTYCVVLCPTRVWIFLLEDDRVLNGSHQVFVNFKVGVPVSMRNIHKTIHVLQSYHFINFNNKK